MPSPGTGGDGLLKLLGSDLRPLERGHAPFTSPVMTTDFPGNFTGPEGSLLLWIGEPFKLGNKPWIGEQTKPNPQPSGWVLAPLSV